jgi:hypothetical protein
MALRGRLLCRPDQGDDENDWYYMSTGGVAVLRMRKTREPYPHCQSVSIEDRS